MGKAELKKVIIVSNYFYPCTLTPSQRISFWARNMHLLGFYPIVITREWSADIRSHQDTKRAIGDETRHVVEENYEVYYLPFKPGLLDRFYLKFGESKLRALFLTAKVADVFLASSTLKFTSFANFQPLLDTLINLHKPCAVIISGEPFYFFKLGYEISKKYDVNWIADYRDDWSTNELQMERRGGVFRRFLLNKESKYEKKWVGTASHIISVSESYTKRISAFVGKPGLTIQNGFEEGLLELPEVEKYENFTLAYSGVLYPSQDISVLLEALKKAKDNGNPIYLIFLGTGFDIKEKKRIESLVGDDIRDFVKVTDRYPRSEALQILKKCHALVSIAYGNMKGIPSSKLYEYIALKTPILLCPSDGDIMEKIIEETGTGMVCNDSETLLYNIERIREGDYSDSYISGIRYNKILQYSRMSQLKKIEPILNG